MKKVRGATSDKFHGEFGGAIAGLANSAKIAVKRAALRNNAAKMSDAAECLRATEDFRIEDQNRASLMPKLPMTEHDTWIRANDADDAVGWNAGGLRFVRKGRGKICRAKRSEDFRTKPNHATDSQTL